MPFCIAKKQSDRKQARDAKNISVTYGKVVGEAKDVPLTHFKKHNPLIHSRI